MGQNDCLISCDDFSKQIRDDCGKAGENLFYTLLCIVFVCQIGALTVTLLMLKIAKTKAKKQLAVLYVPANMTLIGRILLFLDVFVAYGDRTYLLFSSFSTYMFLITALAYIPFLHDMTRVMQTVHV